MAGFRIRLKNNIITSGGILRKMTRTKKPVLGLTTWLLVLLMAGSLSASTVQFTLAHNATSNIFQSYQPLSDQLTSASLYFGGDSEGLSLYGDFNLSFLYKYPAWFPSPASSVPTTWSRPAPGAPFTLPWKEKGYCSETCTTTSTMAPSASWPISRVTWMRPPSSGLILSAS